MGAWMHVRCRRCLADIGHRCVTRKGKLTDTHAIRCDDWHQQRATAFALIKAHR